MAKTAKSNKLEKKFEDNIKTAEALAKRTLKPLTMSDNELVEVHERIKAVDEILNDMSTKLRAELLNRMQKEGVDGKKIDDYILSKVNRVVFDTPVEKAQEFGATKIVKDDAVLKKLYAQGVKIPGVRVSTFLRVAKFEEAG